MAVVKQNGKPLIPTWRIPKRSHFPILSRTTFLSVKPHLTLPTAIYTEQDPHPFRTLAFRLRALSSAFKKWHQLGRTEEAAGRSFTLGCNFMSLLFLKISSQIVGFVKECIQSTSASRAWPREDVIINHSVIQKKGWLINHQKSTTVAWEAEQNLSWATAGRLCRLESRLI